MSFIVRSKHEQCIAFSYVSKVSFNLVQHLSFIFFMLALEFFQSNRREILSQCSFNLHISYEQG